MAGTENKTFWQFPWHYLQSFLISTSLALCGLIIEIVTSGKAIALPKFPNNIILIAGLVFFVLLIHFAFRKLPLVKWFSSVPAAVSSISVFTFIVILMGFIPQMPTNNAFISKFGLNHILDNWMFVFSFFNLELILMFTILKRLSSFSFKNVSFFLNHFGLFLTITAGTLGAGDVQKLAIGCYYNKPAWTGFGQDSVLYELPFALELTKFSIDEYPPELAFVDITENKILPVDKKNPAIISKGTEIKSGNFIFKVDTFYQYSFKMGPKYFPIDDLGSVPSAHITVFEKDKLIGSGWVSSGNAYQKPKLLALNETSAVAMTVPKQKKYSSVFKLYTKTDSIKEITIEVNKPYKVYNWELYQNSYDEEKGKWSEYSVIEAVSDPWLPAVYTGIYMLLIGSVLLFWQGKRKTA